MSKLKTTPEFKETFIDMMRQLPNITAVSRLLGVSPKTITMARKKDPVFDEEVVGAIEEGYDMLEEEARRRAVDGVLEPVFHAGMEVGQVRKYSDQLLVTLLKGYRPKRFNPGVKFEGGDGTKVTMTYNIAAEDDE